MLSYAPEALAEKLSQAVSRLFPDGLVFPGGVYGRLSPEDQERIRAVAVHFCAIVLDERNEFWTTESQAVLALMQYNRELRQEHEGMLLEVGRIGEALTDAEKFLVLLREQAARDTLEHQRLTARVADLEQEHARLMAEVAAATVGLRTEQQRTDYPTTEEQ